MSKEIINTSDGSATISSPYDGESYHSKNGALTESLHIFIENGLNRYIGNIFEEGKHQTNKSITLNILEMGFGTGLNSVATFARSQELENININYHSVEKYPLTKEEHLGLKHSLLFPSIDQSCICKIYESQWNSIIEISNRFKLVKIKGDIEDINSCKPYLFGNNSIDIVFFDAFSPGSQPHLWSSEVFGALYSIMSDHSLLVTYSAKGTVKKALRESGFQVERRAGPPGKRHILAAIKGTGVTF
jgi:tRNA U34 5-methylaminomethyl-2-thiouridine-forming methyltransferase MnmC